MYIQTNDRLGKSVAITDRLTITHVQRFHYKYLGAKDLTKCSMFL